jgi:hypothetical protein
MLHAGRVPSWRPARAGNMDLREGPQARLVLGREPAHVAGNGLRRFACGLSKALGGDSNVTITATDPDVRQVIADELLLTRETRGSEATADSASSDIRGDPEVLHR